MLRCLQVMNFQATATGERGFVLRALQHANCRFHGVKAGVVPEMLFVTVYAGVVCYAFQRRVIGIAQAIVYQAFAVADHRAPEYLIQCAGCCVEQHVTRQVIRLFLLTVRQQAFYAVNCPECDWRHEMIDAKIATDFFKQARFLNQVVFEPGCPAVFEDTVVKTFRLGNALAEQVIGVDIRQLVSGLEHTQYANVVDGFEIGEVGPG